MKFDKGVGKVKTAVTPRKLNLLDGEVRKVTKPNDGLRGGDEGLCKITYGWGDD